MSLSDDFTDRQARVKQLARAPRADELLALYSLYKQATAGDVSGPRPEALDFKGRAKHDAWSARRGTSRADAMAAYVKLVDELLPKYG
ncbi:MAG TPA: acyl-CoA-binding protein [Polyangia bacterium]|nr:acyl-CoA-binding protein [Polyangia bacterium]